MIVYFCRCRLRTGSFDDLRAIEIALCGAYGAWVNTDGFTVGEQKELYAGMRIFELAKQTSSLRHYVWSNLDYALKVCRLAHNLGMLRAHRVFSHRKEDMTLPIGASTTVSTSPCSETYTNLPLLKMARDVWGNGSKYSLPLCAKTPCPGPLLRRDLTWICFSMYVRAVCCFALFLSKTLRWVPADDVRSYKTSG